MMLSYNPLSSLFLLLFQYHDVFQLISLHTFLYVLNHTMSINVNKHKPQYKGTFKMTFNILYGVDKLVKWCSLNLYLLEDSRPQINKNF